MNSTMIENFSMKKQNLQNSLYKGLNNFSLNNKNLGRLCSIPVAVLDVGIDTSSYPVYMINNVAMVAINLIGAAFNREYTLKQAICHTQCILSTPGCFVGHIFTVPLQLIHQVFYGIKDPTVVKPFYQY